MILHVAYNSLDSQECRSYSIIITIASLENVFPAQWIHDNSFSISFKWFLYFWPRHHVAGTNGL